MKPTLDYIYNGYIMDVVKDWDDGCIDSIVTSPPYYLKRKYDGHPKVWDGDPNCKHVWEEIDTLRKPTPGDKPSPNSIIPASYGNTELRPGEKSNVCAKCGAWFGDLGLEPHYSLYVKHICDILGSLWRVLKDTGTLWLNIADSYNGSGGAGNQDTKYRRMHHTQFGKHVESETQSLPTNIKGYSKKCQLGIPWRVALEMIDRGWILRQDIIWKKNGCFPESVTDRFTCDHEYIFMFSKNEKYFFNQQFVPLKDPNFKRITQYGGTQKGDVGLKVYSNVTYSGRKAYDATKASIISDYNWKDSEKKYLQTMHDKIKMTREESKKKAKILFPNDKNKQQAFINYIHNHGNVGIRGKNMRATWKMKGGMVVVDEEYLKWLEAGMPTETGSKHSIWVFPTASFKGSHFAVFPLELPKRCIDASVPKYACKKCGAPRTPIYGFDEADGSGKNADQFEVENKEKGFVGTSRLYPTDRSCGESRKVFKGLSFCGCIAGWESGVVLDPFMGAGTTAIAALKQGKHFIGIEQSAKYVRMANKRIMPYRTTSMEVLR